MSRTKDRIHYYDIARGILMLMVVYYHTMLQVSIPAITNFWDSYFFISFFMAAFFVITGLVTNFTRDSWSQFLLKKFKGLILPTITFLFVQNWLPVLFSPTQLPQYYGLPLNVLTGYMPWFISALFFSLIINYALIRYLPRKRNVFLASLALYLLGVISHTYGWIPYENGDIYCVNHILTMNLFLTLGYLLRGIKLRWWYMLIAIPLYEAVILSTNFLPFGIPYVAGDTLCLDYVSMIPFIIMASCGALTLLILSMLLRENSVLEYIGQHTLGIYILQMGLITPLVQLLLTNQPDIPEHNRVLVFICVVTLVTLISSLISQFLNSKYLKWSMGKF